MSFLPKDYEAPKSASNYMKFEQGANKFRVLSNAVTGYVYWKEVEGKRTPTRVHEFDEVPNEDRGEMKHFWAFTVWNYATSSVQILEITQATIRNTIQVLVGDGDWGDPKKYDLTVTRTGEGLETEYSVVPNPPKKLEADTDVEVNLEALFDGSDPFLVEKETE